MSLDSRIRQQLVQSLEPAASNEGVQLNGALRLLGKWRSALIQAELLQSGGTRVRAGVLKGLDFLPASAEGCHIPKLLGCYEQPLQPHVEAAIAHGYRCVLNIGCAEGYYAVGLARRMPNAQVLAFDTNPAAQQACGQLAARNGVADRIRVGGLFQPEDFAAYEARAPLVFCDIEGAERDLLDPERAPALRTMDLIVESHDCLVPGVTQLLMRRFGPSHDITLVEDDGHRVPHEAPGWFNKLAHLDQLLAVWEWRSGPTPWLVMRSKERRP